MKPVFHFFKEYRMDEGGIDDLDGLMEVNPRIPKFDMLVALRVLQEKRWEMVGLSTGTQ